jgi:hypothetical protein
MVNIQPGSRVSLIGVNKYIGTVYSILPAIPKNHATVAIGRPSYRPEAVYEIKWDNGYTGCCERSDLEVIK